MALTRLRLWFSAMSAWAVAIGALYLRPGLWALLVVFLYVGFRGRATGWCPRAGVGTEHRLDPRRRLRPVRGAALFLCVEGNHSGKIQNSGRSAISRHYK